MTNSDKTLIAALLDRSGSMQTIAGDMRGGFDSFIAKECGQAGTTVVTLAQFDDRYDVVYADNTTGSGGTSFRQTLAGTLSGPLGTGTFSGQLSLTGERRDDPLFGVGASRTITADFGYWWRRLNARLRLAAPEGLAVPTSGLAGDGLFLAPSYDTRTIYAEAYLTGTLTRRLSLRASARAASIDLPDRPSTSEQELRAGLFFSTGVFELSVEDRVARSEDTLFNQVWVTVSRRFGSLF